MKALLAFAAAVAILVAPTSSEAAKKKKNKKGKNAEIELVEVRSYHLWAGEGAVFAGQTAGLALYDVSDPVSPKETWRLPLRATVLDVAIDGERGFAPSVVQRYDPPGKVRRLLVWNDLVYLAESREGLGVVDVSEPDRPMRVASAGTSNEIFALARDGELLATAEGQAGVRVFDLHRPRYPREIVWIASAEGARDVAFADGRLLVAAQRRGLLLYDLTEPRSPKLLAEVPPMRKAQSVVSFGKLALVANGEAGLQVVDPFAPEGEWELAAFRLPKGYPAGRIGVSGSRAYVAIDRWGFAIVDLSDPRAPEVLYPRERTFQISFPK